LDPAHAHVEAASGTALSGLIDCFFAEAGWLWRMAEHPLATTEQG